MGHLVGFPTFFPKSDHCRELEDEAAEFSLLNQQLDQLDQALDAIEQKNDSIHSQLRELLQESKQARLELEAESEKQ